MNHKFDALKHTALIALLTLLPVHYSEAEACAGNVLLLGDSIGAGYGLDEGDSWGFMLSESLKQRGQTFINASVSGESSVGGLRRLPALLELHSPRLLIIELGGNDGLRGYPLKTLRANLKAMIELGQSAGAEVYLLGMRIPPNYGPRYARMFHELYAQLSQEYGTALLPFLLDGIGGEEGLMQADGIHPAKPAQTLLWKNVLQHLPECTQ